MNMIIIYAIISPSGEVVDTKAFRSVAEYTAKMLEFENGLEYRIVECNGLYI